MAERISKRPADVICTPFLSLRAPAYCVTSYFDCFHLFLKGAMFHRVVEKTNLRINRHLSMCVCVCVCVCLFPFTVKASPDWMKQLMKSQSSGQQCYPEEIILCQAPSSPRHR